MNFIHWLYEETKIENFLRYTCIVKHNPRSLKMCYYIK